MSDEKITKAPSKSVSSLSAPKRRGSGSYVFETSWKVPSAMTSKKKKDRITGLQMLWTVQNSKTGWHIECKDSTGNETDTDDTVNLNNFKKSWDRRDFWPGGGLDPKGKKLTEIGFGVRGYNVFTGDTKKKKHYGPWATSVKSFTLPKKPTLSTPSIDSETKNVSCTLTTDAGNGMAERYDTRWRVKKYNSRTKKWTVVQDDHSTSTSRTLTCTVPEFGTLQVNDFIQIVFEAAARGVAGSTEWGDCTKTYYVSWPAKPSIDYVKPESKEKSDGTVMFDVKTNHSKEHPVDRVKLEVLKDTEITDPDTAMASQDWFDSDNDWGGNIDNKDCKGMIVNSAVVTPETAGRHTWVRLKAYRLNLEGERYRYSEPKMLKDLETPAASAVGDKADVVSLVPGADGKSLVAVIGWQDDGDTGTEITWSDSLDTWESTENPDSHEFEWHDATSAATGYDYTATITIKGLEEGTRYFVKARRYNDDDSGLTYSGYSDPLAETTTASPTSVYLNVPQFTRRGEGCSLSWTFDTTATQAAYVIGSGDDEGFAIPGTGPTGARTLSSDEVAQLLALSATTDQFSVRVAVSTGGDWVVSEAKTVHVADPPTLSMSVAATLAAQPLQLAFTVDTANADIAYTVEAQGVGGDAPYGRLEQVAGDVVHSDYLSPAYTDNNNGTYTATVDLPTGLAFHDNGGYTVTATAIDRDSGLASAEAVAEFSVKWSHQAPAPSEDIVLVPIDEVDEDGYRTRAVAIALEAPVAEEPGDVAETDVYDVYRVTPGGETLIAEGLDMDASIVDWYAPFGRGDYAYRVVTRTADGDTDWLEFPYELTCKSLRFDFSGDRYVELDYDISIGDSYEKDFEAREHMDGTRAGYWNAGIRHKSSLSTNVVRVEGEELISSVLDLAAHVGSVFVRTPDGAAYEANVDVSDLGSEADSGVFAVAFDAEEISPTGAFSAEVPREESE